MPTSTRAASSPSDAAVREANGSGHRSRPATIGRKISSVVTWRSPHHDEDENEDGDAARPRKGGGAGDSGLGLAPPGARLARGESKPAQRAGDHRLLDEPAAGRRKERRR